MIVVDPKDRATLHEILNHPWMTKGFNAPPENFLPQREPLQLPLDPQVVEKMQGFDFGSAAFITDQLTHILSSDDYQAVVRRYYREEVINTPGSNEKKRGMFDFYKRRNSISREGLTTPSSEAIRGYDPVNAYSPLISIYYLAKEKLEAEQRDPNPGALGIVSGSGDLPLPVTGLSSPQAAHTNTYAPEMPGEKATGGRSRPRARTNGEDEIAQGMQKLDTSANHPSPTPPSTNVVPPSEQPAKEGGRAMGLLRRFSTRRGPRKEDTDRPTPPSLNIQPPQDSAAPPRKSFSVRRSRRRDPSPTTMHQGGSQPQHEGLLSAGTGIAKARNFLNRSTSVNSADYRTRRVLQRNVSAADSPRLAPEPPATSGSDRSSASARHDGRGVELTDKPAPNASPFSVPPRTPQTSRTKSLGHARQESIQARRRRWEEAKRDRHAQVPEETDAELRDEADGLETPAVPDTPAEEISRPAGLKGLFSTSTTSSKSPEFIRQDIIRVLNQLGVQYTMIRGGFSCRHVPSINLEDVQSYTSPLMDDEKSGRVASGHNRRISFGAAFRGKDREDLRDEKMQRHQSTKARRHPDQSFVTNSEGSEEYIHHNPSSGRRNEESHTDAGATRTKVQDDNGERLVLKFEIAIVKIPLLSLHGIQFKKVHGGMNQYRSMTGTILSSLRL